MEKTMIADHIFRQYDIRGKVGSELPIDQVYDLTKAILYYFVTHNPQLKTICVGADGRVHSPAIKQEVCRAILDSGLEALYVGPCPTPVVYFSLHTLPVDAGLMITASHNGKEYNGIKICLGKESVAGKEIQKIKELYKSKAQIQAKQQGLYREYDLINDYITWMFNHFSDLKHMKLSAILDCGNGAAGTVLPRLIERMQWQNVQLLYCEVDGNYPHHEADPIVEENMRDLKKALQSSQAQIGMGFDGDCDRMAPMTKEGELVYGDKLLSLFAQDIVKKHTGAAVVFDVKCSSGLSDLLNQWGAQPIMSATGHSRIKAKMKETKALLAGELSCHFFFADRYFGYDDGVYAALRLLQLLQQSGKTLTALLSIFPHKFSSAELRIECPEDKKITIVNAVKKQFARRTDMAINEIDGIRVTMPFGWGNLRASNTQPVLTLRFEADTQQGLQQLQQEFYNALLPYIDQSILNKYFEC